MRIIHASISPGPKKQSPAQREDFQVKTKALIAKMNRAHGWMLSVPSERLGAVLQVAPQSVRVGIWVKPFCLFKPGVNPAYAWEAVVFKGGRELPREQDHMRDYVSEMILLKKGKTDSKPLKVALWMFEFLGMLPGDVFEDFAQGTDLMESWQFYERHHGMPPGHMTARNQKAQPKLL